nr:unnamed protein product [Callosobruchus chinensis]
METTVGAISLGSREKPQRVEYTQPSGPRNFACEELHNVESDMYSQNFEYYPYDNSYTEYYPSTENQLDNENYYYSSEPSVSVDSNQNHEENFQKEPFEVTSVFQHSKRDYCADIPAFPEFNIREPIKFHLFKFHKYFDGLIGLDILKLLNSHIDLSNSMLPAPPLSSKIEPHTAAHVKIPVSTFHGDILLPPSKINDCVIRETLSEAVDGYP